MKYLLLLLPILSFSQPEMIIDPIILKNSFVVKRFNITEDDTSWVCFQEGHYVMGNHRYIAYHTALANVGDSVGYYGNPETDTANWEIDACHGHYHYKNGIQVDLLRWENNQWTHISRNSKLDYDMVNQDKYPVGYTRVFNGTQFVNELRTYYLADLSWFTQYSEIDSEYSSRVSVQWCGFDPFYICPDDDYNSGNRGLLPYYVDLYSNSTEGNWSLLGDSINAFYRIRAWHTPPFEQRNLFPDTADVTFYLNGDEVITDTLPTIDCNVSNPAPSSISINGRLVSWDSTGACEYILERLLVKGNQFQASAVYVVNSNSFYDSYAPPSPNGAFYRYRIEATLSNKIKLR